MALPLGALRDGMLFARDFRVVRALAEGGMSAVYVAEQISSGRQRALKVMSADLVRDASSREQFVQEARIGGRIKSGHVVEVIAAGIDEDTELPWMAMELLEGEDLAELVGRRGPLALHEVREIFDQLADALGAAHSAGVIHRDIKPRNIFVARSQLRGMPFVVKVLDFGISKLIARSDTSVSATRQLGSPLFMAPEQARSGAKLRRSTDVWPLGLLAYYLLTGRYYWTSVSPDGVDLNALLMEIAVDPIEAPTVRAEQQGNGGLLPAGFDGWFSKCLQRDPEARFMEASECIATLKSVLGRRREGFEDGSEPTTIHRLPDAEADAGLEPEQTLGDTDVSGMSQRPRERRSHDEVHAGSVTTEAAEGTTYDPWAKDPARSAEVDRSRPNHLVAFFAVVCFCLVAGAVGFWAAGLRRTTVRSVSPAPVASPIPPVPDRPLAVQVLPVAPVLVLPAPVAPRAVPPPEPRRPPVAVRPPRNPDPPRPTTGRLAIGADPPRCIAVTVDGRRVGTTPVFDLELPVGEHQVACLRSGGGRMVRSVRIERGRERELVFPAP